MKFIVETVENVEFLVEAADGGRKNYYLQGIFMQANQPNRNKRMYPDAVLFPEVERYNKEMVATKRALGELGHTDKFDITMERVSHLIESLEIRGNDIYGKALLLNTPYGEIAKGLIDGG